MIIVRLCTSGKNIQRIFIGEDTWRLYEEKESTILNDEEKKQDFTWIELIFESEKTHGLTAHDKNLIFVRQLIMR